MIDIVIVNWNSGDYLTICLRTVFTDTNKNIINHVYIIDNNSSDHSMDKLPVNEKIIVIHNQENIGFSRACNQGFKLCKATFVLLLNPDTQLFDTTLHDCENYMINNPQTDVLGCKLLVDSGEIATSCSRFPTPLRIFFDAAGLSKIAPGIFKPASFMTDWDHKESRYVDQIIGAFMFMRGVIFEKVGFFDERFFVYYEELDFSKRLAALGGKSFYNADISAIHSENGTTNSVKAFRLFLNLKSKLQYSKKHFSKIGHVLVWVSTMIIEPVSRTLFLTFAGRFREIKDVLKGYKLLMQYPNAIPKN